MIFLPSRMMLFDGCVFTFFWYLVSITYGTWYLVLWFRLMVIGKIWRLWSWGPMVADESGGKSGGKSGAAAVKFLSAVCVKWCLPLRLQTRTKISYDCNFSNYISVLLIQGWNWLKGIWSKFCILIIQSFCYPNWEIRLCFLRDKMKHLIAIVVALIWSIFEIELHFWSIFEAF